MLEGFKLAGRALLSSTQEIQSQLSVRQQTSRRRASTSKQVVDPSWTSQAIINSNTKMMWKNMIAYDVCSGPWTNGLNMLSYLSFMKSLIQTTEDVKELREKKILYNLLDMFNDINAHGIAASLYKEVHYQIQAHCRSRSKNWVAELVHANFQSPWKFIAFVAAVALLAISAGQLYYAVHPN